jgi:hypothetical protein
MSIKFVSNKRYLENVNGLKNFGESNIDYDSERDKNKQVRANLNSNGNQYYIEDSLQKFMNILPKRHNSIFDLLKYDLNEIKKGDSVNLSEPSKIIKLKPRNLNETKKLYTGKHKVSRGITSKLFDFDKTDLPNVPNYVPHIVPKSSSLDTKKHVKKHGKIYGKKHSQKQIRGKK